jgi:hypothetical protein
MENVPLIKEDYDTSHKAYPIRKPDIPSGSTYYFETDSGLTYQVTFGKKKNNYLGNIINFSVISEEFEDEYSETNKGEVYSIIATMIEIVKIYHDNHPYSNSYEFSGEFKDNRDEKEPSIRSRLYFREANRLVDLRYWNIELQGNKVLLTRKHP